MKKYFFFVSVLLTAAYLNATDEYKSALFETVTEINGTVTVYQAKSLFDCSLRYLKLLKECIIIIK